MRAVLMLLAASLLTVAPAAAQPRKPAPAPAPAPIAAKAEGPRKLASFDDWTAATNLEAGQTVCYAFTYASHSAPAIPGRDKVVMTVTERPSGRDAVAISAGFAYPTNASVTVHVDQTALDFYAAGHSAFARDGHAAVAALGRGREVTARSTGPRVSTVTDTFSLKGFGHAYEAISKACPTR
jgi:hypothetical protein